MADLALTKKSETSSKITFTYPKVATAEGYQYYANGVKVSRTLNPDDLEVTFAKVASGSYRVVPIDIIERADGYVWPAPTPPGAQIPTVTVAPTITGTPKVGQVLTCNPGTWTGNPTFTYQWWYENIDGTGDVRIDGYTQPTYTPVDADAGGRDYCVVTATNSAGSATATGGPTGTIQPAGTPPPPDGTFPPTYADWSDDFSPAPDSRWTWVLAGNGDTGFPSAGASLVPDGEGGNAVRLTSPAVGGNGQLASFYDGSGAYGKQGQNQFGQIEFRIIQQNQFSWVFEWHEMADQGINSCAIGVNTNKTIRIQVSGGPTAGHQYTELNDTQTLVTNRFYKLEWDIVWSTGSAGKFAVKLDGRQIINVSRPTLLFKDGSSVPDNVVIGGYSYNPTTGATPAQVFDFRKFAVGVV
jgi:hypothetical protein